MATIVTREVGATAKGSPLSNAEIDQNFINLNTEVDPVLSYPSIAPSLLLDFANTKRLDPRVTFTRSTTAVYYDGVTTAMAEQNLLTYSEQFDNPAWSKGNVTVTANSTTAPDGTTTADTNIPDTAVAFHRVEQSFTWANTTYTYSCYAKASGYNFVLIRGYTNGGNTCLQSFNLQTGVIGATTSGTLTASITSVGNGWYRCAITFATGIAATGNVGIIPSSTDSGANYAGDGTSGVFIWGAQLEQRSSVTAYTPTNAPIASGTELVTNGDFSSGTSWTLGAGWSISSGALNGATGAFSVTSQTGAYVAGRTYRVQLDVTCSAGYVNVYINSGTGYIAQTTAKHVFYLVAGSSTSILSLGGASFTGTIDNVSVQEVTSYTAGPVTNYIPQLLTAAAGVPRFDCNPTTGESLGLLIEEQRTNLLTYSEDFSNPIWTKTNINVAQNTISPSGSLNASQISTGAAGANSLNRSVTLNPATFSVYLKAGISTTANIKIQSDVAGRNVSYNVNLSNGTMTAGTGNTGNLTGWIEYTSITYVGNGWYRVSIGFSSTTSTVTSTYSVSPSANGSAAAANESVFVWGAQLEAGAGATSYIPTVASTVTRNADAASMTGTAFSSWYNAAEGTMYFDGFVREDGSVSFYTTLLSAAAGNTIATQIGFVASSSGAQLLAQAGASSVNIGSLSSTPTAMKLAMGYAPNSLAGSKDGGAAVTTGTVTLPGGVDRLFIGGAVGASGSPASINGTIKKIAYYPQRLTNAQLQAITG